MKKTKRLCAFIMACGMALGMVGCAGSQAMADTPKGEYEMTIKSEMQGDTLVLLDGDIAQFALNYKKDGTNAYNCLRLCCLFVFLILR